MGKTGLDVVRAIRIQENSINLLAMGIFASETKIMTPARSLWKKSNPKISVRKPSEELVHEVKIYRIEYSRDIALLEIVGDYKSSTYGQLARDGTLRASDKLYTFANSRGIAETCVRGSVGSSCKNVPSMDWRTTQCKDNNFDHVVELLDHRKLGHFWNESTLEKCTSQKEFEFGGQLMCDLPVIECRRFNIVDNCIGCSVFKENGDIVGMFIKGNYFRIALHVCVLQDFLDRLL